MVRRLIIAAAVAVASLGANADSFRWTYLLDGTQYQARNNSADRSLYVFVTGESPSGGINNIGTLSDSSYAASKIRGTTYTVQSKNEALNKISNIIASGKADDLGNLTMDASSASWIGNASFTAFAVLLNAADITKATSYRLFEDYSVVNVVNSGSRDFRGSETPFVSKASTQANSSGDSLLVTWGAVMPDPNSSSGGTSGMPAWAESPASSSWLDIATIPEPTSGVMLLLGVAALALKRKRAA